MSYWRQIGHSEGFSLRRSCLRSRLLRCAWITKHLIQHPAGVPLHSSAVRHLPHEGKAFLPILLPYLARKILREKQSSLLPIIPGENLTIGKMDSLFMYSIRTFLLRYTIGLINFALKGSESAIGSSKRLNTP